MYSCLMVVIVEAPCLKSEVPMIIRLKYIHYTYKICIHYTYIICIHSTGTGSKHFLTRRKI